MVSFSVVIPTFRRNQNLTDCLDCLAHYFTDSAVDNRRYRIEVIVSDDANDTELKTLIGERYPWCSYTVGPSRGPAANRNHGAKTSSADWLIFIDDDCLPQFLWIESYEANTNKYDVLEGRTSPLGTRTRVDEECPINETGGFLWACNFAIRREIFLTLGGFDEGFLAPAMEDVELNMRINKLGLKRKFLPAAYVLHPWRRRKGLLFVNAYATSLSKFVTLHPETAESFTFDRQFISFLRIVKSSTAYAIKTRQFNGFSRHVFLSFYSCFVASYAVWNSRPLCQ